MFADDFASGHSSHQAYAGTRDGHDYLEYVLNTAKVAIFDLDDVLITHTPETRASFADAAARFVCSKIEGLSLEDARKIAKQSFDATGNSVQFFVDEDKGFKLDPRELHVGFHKLVSPRHLRLCEYTPKLLREFGIEKVLLTDGSKGWAEVSTAFAGIDAIDPKNYVAREEVDMHLKEFSTRPFERALEIAGAYPEQAVMFEDKHRNLAKAKGMGFLGTILIRHYRDIPSQPHVDFVFDSTASCLELAAAMRPVRSHGQRRGSAWEIAV